MYLVAGTSSPVSLYVAIRTALATGGDVFSADRNHRAVAFSPAPGMVGIAAGANDAERAEIESDWATARGAYAAMMAA